jgi:hypothetical protein
MTTLTKENALDMQRLTRRQSPLKAERAFSKKRRLLALTSLLP